MKVHNCAEGEYPKAFEVSDQFKFSKYGFECGDGWYDIMEPIVRYIHEYNSKVEETNPNADFFEYFIIRQVKEKFATLRFYVNQTDHVLDRLITLAEEKSSTTCETCGKEGEIRGKYWIYTACEDHTKDNDKQSIYN